MSSYNSSDAPEVGQTIFPRVRQVLEEFQHHQKYYQIQKKHHHYDYGNYLQRVQGDFLLHEHGDVYDFQKYCR